MFQMSLNGITTTYPWHVSLLGEVDFAPLISRLLTSGVSLVLGKVYSFVSGGFSSALAQSSSCVVVFQRISLVMGGCVVILECTGLVTCSRKAQHSC